MTMPAIAPPERLLWWVWVGSPLEAPLVGAGDDPLGDSVAEAIAEALDVADGVALEGSEVDVMLLRLEKETLNQSVLSV